MTNGHATTEINTPADQPAVVTVNFGLKGKHLAAACVGLASLIGSGALAGWLVLPSDMRVVQNDVQRLSQDMVNMQQAVTKLTTAVEVLSLQIATKGTSKPRAAAKAPPKAKSIWD